MTRYARVNPDTASPEARDFAAPPSAAKGWLPLVIDAQPTPSGTQTVESGPITFTATQAHQTWLLVAKTQAVLDREADAAELEILRNVIAALQAGTGTAAERLQRLERTCVWLLKQSIKRGVV